MANNKSEQHIINLANPDLNRERLKGEIMPWDGFNDRNSPYLSGECLPLYSKTISGTDQWISPSLDVYKVSNRRLTKNGQNISQQLDSVVKTKVYNGDSYYVFGGTESLYFAAEYGQDALRVIIGGSTRITITYGDGFSWDKAVSWFGASFARINNVQYIGVCYCGRCYVYESDDGGTSWSSSYSPNNLNATGEYGNHNTTIYIGLHHTFFACDGMDSMLVHRHDTGSSGWNSYQTLSVTLNSVTQNVLAKYIHMDQSGNLTVDRPFNLGSPWDMQGWGDIFYIIYDETQWSITRTTQNVFTPEWDGPDTVDVTITSDSYYSSRYGIFSRAASCTPDSEDFGDIYEFSIMLSTIPGYSTGTGIINGNIETGAQRCLGDHFRLLYGQGYLNSISVTEGPYYRGTLIAPWGTVDSCFYWDYELGYHSTEDDTWYNIRIDQTDPDFVVYRDRYIILRTSKYFNAYDTVDNVWLHFSDDWNNRYLGERVNNFHWYLVASGVESEYDKTQYPFPGYQSGICWAKTYQGDSNISKIPNPDAYGVPSTTGITAKIPYINFFSTNYWVTSSDTINWDKTPDFSLDYRISYGRDWVELAYDGIYWTLDDNALINPSLFATFQTDLYTLIKDGLSTALALQQFGQEYLVYYQLSADISFTRLCCIQSLFYGLTDDGIYSVDLSNGILSNSKKIANITGLQYIAYNPLGIVFWNPRNRTMYMFTGDAVLKPIEGQSSFTSITQSKFRPDTEETFMLTNNGLYVSAGQYCYNIKGNYTDVFFTDYGFALKTSNSCTCYSYYPATGHTTLVPLVLETMLYGAGNNIISTTDCIYFRFYRGDIGNGTATVEITGNILTDYSTDLQPIDAKRFLITSDKWDPVTNTYYYRYQPTFQKGIGISIKVVSDVPLIYMGFGAKTESLQITKS